MCVCVCFDFSFAQTSWCSCKLGRPLLWLSSLSTSSPQKHSAFPHSFGHVIETRLPCLRSADQFYFLICLLVFRFCSLIPLFCHLVVSCVKTLMWSCTQWLCGCECAAVDCLRGRGHIDCFFCFFNLSQHFLFMTPSWPAVENTQCAHQRCALDKRSKRNNLDIAAGCAHLHTATTESVDWHTSQSLTFVVQSQFGYISRQNLLVRFRKTSLFGLKLKSCI